MHKALDEVGQVAAGARHFWNVVDSAAAVAAVSSPIWWTYVNSLGHLALLLVGVVGGALRIALMLRDLRKERP
jgi:hypothetical protein